MNNVFATKTPITVEQQSQLAKPHGKKAMEVGEHLFSGNAEVIDQLIKKIDNKPNLAIIDLGTGPGYSLIELAKLLPSAEITGVDPSSEMIKLAKQKILDANLINHKITLSIDETPKSKLSSNRYDYALLSNVIYFWNNPVLHLNEVNRILKPEGSILIYFTSKESLSERINETDGIFKMYSIDEVLKLLIESGFHESKHWTISRKIGQTGYVVQAIKK